jgi:hypothetical protein
MQRRMNRDGNGKEEKDIHAFFKLTGWNNLPLLQILVRWSSDLRQRQQQQH